MALCGAIATSAAQAAVDISSFNVAAIREGGSTVTQAGSHPWELQTEVAFAGVGAEGGLRDLHIALPPGLIENSDALQKCTDAQFSLDRVSPYEASASGESCPDRSQVGTITVQSEAFGTRTFGLFNLTPPNGSPNRLGASPFGIPLTFTSHIRQEEGEYALVLDLREAPSALALSGWKMEVWGTPWNITHNAERGNCLNEADPSDPWAKCSIGRPRSNAPTAYLTMPSSCTGALETTVVADSQDNPGAYRPNGEPDLSDPAWSSSGAIAAGKLTGCNLIPFAPDAQGQLTTDRAASATGFDLVFDISEEGLLDPRLIAPSQPREAVVTLAEGMTLNPSVAAGLGVCTPAQFAAETASSAPGAGCPNASKIGDLHVESPLYEKTIEGSIYLAEPNDPEASGKENPFDSLLALYLVAKSRARGVVVKVPGHLDPDPATGRLTAIFTNLPQLPYAHFRVHFREGQRSPLLSPPSCAIYQTEVALTPWLEAGQTITRTPSFPIAHGIEGRPCPNGSTPPFTPGAVAGSLNSQAGVYSPFYLHLTRTDPEQEITSYSAQLPPGLLGKIAGVPFCPEAAIAAAARRTGKEEERDPSCPAASSIGHTYTGYGVGPVLAYAPGGLYLAGPFHGAPLSIIAIDSATVGPFDLGVIEVRSAIKVDPRSAQVSIDSAASTPIPHIIDGIPLHLRDIRVYISRPNFTINPTSCNPFSVISTMTGSAPPFTNPVDSHSSPSARYQVSNCSSLGFGPKLTMRLKGGTHRGAFPSLRATLTPRAGDANIGAAAVTLPASEFLAQNHIKTICTAPKMEAEACPPDSVYGHATAVTLLLEEPMRGPVYLRSSANLLPDLVAVLHGRGVRIVVEGRIDSSHGGLRGTFTGLPDAPVTKFTMVLNGGKRGLLANEKNLCAKPRYASSRLLGQAGLGAISQSLIRVDCKKKKPKKGKRGGGGR
jgi:hypothetical protein